MSFAANIDAKKHKSMWSKSITSLSSISEAITFTISNDKLSISATNASKTSFADIIFNRSFFNNYQVDFDSISLEGYSKDTQSYSLMINSKHLATLFKNLESSNSLEYIMLQINWSSTSLIHQHYKLFIEIKTKKQIIKKFQTSYIPVLKQDIKIASTYKKYLTNNENNLKDHDRINHMIIDQIIPKQFLEMVPNSAEDFKIEIKNDKITLGGYTKQVVKDRDYLKQPMAVTVTLGLEELTDSNLQNEEDEFDFKKLINFGMKEFRNFLGLINFLNQSSNYNEQIDDEYVSVGGQCDYFHIYFRNPGDPILFDLQNNPNLEIQFIQITSEDKSISGEKEVQLDKTQLSIQVPVVQNVEKKRVHKHNQGKSIQKSTFGKLSKNNTIFNRNELKSSERMDFMESFDNGITYEQDQESVKGAADTDYSSSDEEPPHKRRLIEESLGPTQVDKPKSIF